MQNNCFFHHEATNLLMSLKKALANVITLIIEKKKFALIMASPEDKEGKKINIYLKINTKQKLGERR